MRPDRWSAFFFQAEDGIRDLTVTGVQTCALPIYTEGNDILARLKTELAPESNQLIALWGPGGTGKTTLAAQVARELRPQFPQRLAWVSALARADFTLATLLDDVAAQLGRTDLRPLKLEDKEPQVA